MCCCYWCRTENWNWNWNYIIKARILLQKNANSSCLPKKFLNEHRISCIRSEHSLPCFVRYVWKSLENKIYPKKTKKISATYSVTHFLLWGIGYIYRTIQLKRLLPCNYFWARILFPFAICERLTMRNEREYTQKWTTEKYRIIAFHKEYSASLLSH